jgi:hypothetical protein
MTDGLENNVGENTNLSPKTEISNQDTSDSVSPSSVTVQESTVNKQEVVAKPEKVFSRDEVAKIVNAEKNKALEREREKIRSELTTQQQSNAQTGQGRIYTEQEIESIVNKVADQRVHQVVANKIVDEFSSKMLAAKSKYSDFEETVGKLNLVQNPILVQWANSVDNTADIIYDIAKNPAKLVTILALAGHSPELAFDEVKKLSSSIKQNEEALKRQQPKEPLSQVQPSNTGVDNGSKTITDLRKEKWLWA